MHNYKGSGLVMRAKEQGTVYNTQACMPDSQTNIQL